MQKHTTKHTTKHGVGVELTSLEYQRTFVSYGIGHKICTTRYQDIEQDIKQDVKRSSEVM